MYYLISIAFLATVIVAYPLHDYRCSHVPPAPDNMTHVWLDDATFISQYDEQELVSGYSQYESQLQHESNRSRRQLIGPGELHESSDLVSNILKRLKPYYGASKDDLVPIRIKVYYDDSVQALEKEKVDLITKTVIPSVIDFFENVLLIRREYTIDKFRVSRRCPNNTIYYARDLTGLSKAYCMDRCENYAVCGEMAVPSNHLSACSYCNSTSKKCHIDYLTEGKGVSDAHLLLYVSANQTIRCKKDQTIAYAAHCAQDSKTDRPVAGHANLCPSSISTDAKDLKALIATVKHELTHVLGFSLSLFAYYRDEHGRPLTKRDSAPGPLPVDPKTGYAKWSDKVIKKIVRKSWSTGAGEIDKDVHLVVTPTVVREARKHFNCSTLEGAELEDQGSDGTSMTHWEKRIFENEAMTGTHTQNSVYSRLTLAVLQDTGWYVANFSRADKLEWGKDLGCEFAKKSCKSWIDERRAKKMSIKPFCDRVKGDVLQIACTDDRTSKAVCNMKQYSQQLPLVYQNFDSLEGVNGENVAFYGGSVDLADYCPFIQEFTWQAHNVTIRGSRCDHGDNNLGFEKNAALELYGPETKCFDHGRRWEQKTCVYRRQWHHFGAGCYQYTCSNGHFDISIGNYSYPCYYSGQIIHVEQMVNQWLYNGTVICPACGEVCAPSNCMSFDRRIIDKFLNWQYNLVSIADTSNNDSLKAFLKDTLNSIDPFDSEYTTMVIKPKHTSYKSSLTVNSTEYLLQMFARHQKQPTVKLICSSASVSAETCYVYLLMILINMFIPLMFSLNITETGA